LITISLYFFRVKRKSALSNIINNYFGTDPFTQDKQKPRLHIPPGKQNIQQQRAANSNSNNNNNSSTFSKRFLVKPLNVRLGPPIKILPTLNRPQPQPQQQQQPKPFQQQKAQPPSSEDVYRASVPAPLLASGFKEESERGRVPAPLLARNDGSAAKRPNEEFEKTALTGQTFSQLVSNNQVSARTLVDNSKLFYVSV
jgi:hypothetical protein